MAPQNPTIIVGHLDSSELTKSIDTLVAEVAKKTSGMAEDGAICFRSFWLEHLQRP